MRAIADIEHSEEENDNGFLTPCVYAICTVSDDKVGPIWGDSEASVKRALATLSEECSCGAGFHAQEE